MTVVTGGAGFIGSNVVAALERCGERDIVVVDRLGTDEKWKNVAKRCLAAIVEPERIFGFLDNHADEIEVIVHLGAISSTTETDADLIVRTNFTLSWNLWVWCRERGVRFIYASSAATYGDGALGFADDDSPGFLNALRPLSAYGWSKALFDRKVTRELAEGRGAPPQHAGLKFFNVYGPNEYHKGGQQSVVAHIFPAAARGEEVKLFKSGRADVADGEQKRDFVWVGDVADVILWLLGHSEVSGLFNVGSGEARSFRELAEATFAGLGVPAKIGYREMPEDLRAKYQYFTEAPLAKLRAAGYAKPMTALEDGVGRYVRDYLMKEDRYV